MTEETLRPAWSQSFTAEAIEHLVAEGPFGKITPEWAWGGSTGKGVRVAVVDSGIEHDHPAVGKSVKGGVIVEYDSRAKDYHRIRPDDRADGRIGSRHGLRGDHSRHCAAKPNCSACGCWVAV